MLEQLTNFHAPKLRLIRLFHGRSLEEVAADISATRQFVHQIESGAKSPSEETEEVLADALGVLRNYFRIPLRNAVNEDQCHFRKQLTTPISLTQQVLARGTLLDEFVSCLSSKLVLPVVNFLDLSVKTSNDIEQAAEACRHHWGLGLTGPIVNMTRVVENAGAVVTHFGSLSERVDALSMSRPRPIIVRSSTKESACRLRFDLAHECGHLVMHQGIVTGDRTTEDQANRFASAFLLPRITFAREFPRNRFLNWKALFELKLRWKVSVRAIIRRAYDLSLIDGVQYRRANIHLVKAGQAKIEQHDDEIQMEQPELLNAALFALESSHGGSLNKIVSSIGIGSSVYEKLTGRKMPVTASQSRCNSQVVFMRSFRKV